MELLGINGYTAIREYQNNALKKGSTYNQDKDCFVCENQKELNFQRLVFKKSTLNYYRMYSRARKMCKDRPRLSICEIDNRDSHEIRQYMTDVRDSLKDRYPEIAVQWHATKNGILQPSVFLCGSDFKAWWLCPVCGHEWKTFISHRTNGTGCPVCYRQQNKIIHPLAKKVY